MLKVQEIRELIKLIDHSNIEEFIFEQEGSKIKIKKNTSEMVNVVTESSNNQRQKWYINRKLLNCQ